MRQTLKQALSLMFGHEGGYVNAKTDAGGPTKYGITQKTLAAYRGHPVTIQDVKNLTLVEAEAIYRKNYWVQSGGDQLPLGLDYAAFDFGMNSGPTRAVKELQKVLAAAGKYAGKIDGFLGPQSLAGANTYPGGVLQLIKDFCAARMVYLKSLKGPKGFPANGRGWTIRVTGKDPKGEWKDQPGVIGNAIIIAKNATSDSIVKPLGFMPETIEIAAQALAPASSESIGLGTILAKPEVLAVLSALVPVLTGLATDNPYLKMAFAAITVMAAGTGMFYFVQRIRRAG